MTMRLEKEGRFEKRIGASRLMVVALTDLPALAFFGVAALPSLNFVGAKILLTMTGYRQYIRGQR
jgi:hypothetical protein